MKPQIALVHSQGSNYEKVTGRVSNTAGTKGLGCHNGMNWGLNPQPRQFEPCS